MTSENKVKRDKLEKSLNKKGYDKARISKLLRTFDSRFTEKEEKKGFVKEGLKYAFDPLIETGVQGYNAFKSGQELHRAKKAKRAGDEAGYQEHLRLADEEISQERRIMGSDFESAVDVKDTMGGAVKDMVTTGVQLGSMFAPTPIKGVKAVKALNVAARAAGKPATAVATKLGGRIAYNAAQGALEEGARAIGDDKSAGDVAKQAIRGGIGQAAGAEIFRGIGKGISKGAKKTKTSVYNIVDRARKTKNKSEQVEIMIEGVSRLKKEYMSETDKIANNVLENPSTRTKMDLEQSILDRKYKEDISFAKNPFKKVKTVKTATNKGATENIIDNITRGSEIENQAKRKIIGHGEARRQNFTYSKNEYTEPATQLYDNYIVPLQTKLEEVGEVLQKKVREMPDEAVEMLDESTSFFKSLTSKNGLGVKITGKGIDGEKLTGLDPFNLPPGAKNLELDFTNSKIEFSSGFKKDITDMFNGVLNKGGESTPNKIYNLKVSLDEVLRDMADKGTDTTLTGRTLGEYKTVLLNKLAELDPSFDKSNREYAVITEALAPVKSKLLKGGNIKDFVTSKKMIEDSARALSSEGTELNKQVLDNVVAAMDFTDINIKNGTDIRKLFDFSRVVAKTNKEIQSSLKNSSGFKLLNLKDAAGAVVSNFGKIKYAAGIAGSITGNKKVKYMQSLIGLIENYGTEVANFKAPTTFGQKVAGKIGEEFSEKTSKAIIGTGKAIGGAVKSTGANIRKAGETNKVIANITEMSKSGQLSDEAMKQINRILRYYTVKK